MFPKCSLNVPRHRYASLVGGTSGSVTGVGVEVGFEDDGKGKTQMLVVTPRGGSPAEKAGILPGDLTGLM
eukprot:1183795-Prorocentrum_minimum.AAC.5